MTARSLSAAEKKIRRAMLWSFGVLLIVVFGGGLLWWISTPTPTSNSIDVEPAALLPLADDASASARPADQPDQPDHPVGRIRFTDISEAAGLHFAHYPGDPQRKWVPDTMGSGVVFFDADNDGDQDLLALNVNELDRNKAHEAARSTLFLNDGTGRFAAADDAAGLNLNAYAMGAAVADFDGDGWVDVFVTTLGPNRLFRNLSGEREGIRFVEVTEQAGVAGSAADWSTAATFVDVDRDGWLDLFVGNYVAWSPTIDSEIDFRLPGIGRTFGSPTHYPGSFAHLYRNLGDGRFADISAQAGIQVRHENTGQPTAKALGVSVIDANADGWPDLLVANDTTRNLLFINNQRGGFDELGELEGVAYDINGKARAGMGIDAAHYRNDRELAVAVGNFGNEMSAFFVNRMDGGPFADEAIISGIGAPSRLALTFAVLFFDADLDGDLDYFQANGHLEPEIHRVQTSQRYAQRPQLFRNCGAACGYQFELAADAGFDRALVGRGAAFADIDADGDLDLAIAQNGRPLVLYRNDSESSGAPRHWLRVTLLDPGSPGNRHGLGATIRLAFGDQDPAKTQIRRVTRTRGYLSQVELPVTFGFGDSVPPKTLGVTWPDGEQQAYPIPAIDQTITLTRVAPRQP